MFGYSQSELFETASGDRKPLGALSVGGHKIDWEAIEYQIRDPNGLL